MFRTAISLGLLVCHLSLHAEDDIDRLVNNLVTLRGQVEDLQSELKIQTEEHKNTMAYLSTRRTELQANVDRERLRVAELNHDLETLRVRIAELGTDSDTLIPDVIALITQTSESIENGIPFKQVERRQALEETRLRLEGRKITAQKAVNELWAFIEDDIRLTRENALYSQTIRIDGENVLADVAKLGTVMMFFRTRDDDVGQAVRSGSQWRFEVFDEPQRIEQVSLLFDALQKQIRQGYFTLPLSLEQIAGDS